MWNVEKAVSYLDAHANGFTSLGRCAEFVRKAIEAGGATLALHGSAKDYGPSLVRAMFIANDSVPVGFFAGDVAVIQPIDGHPHGHMAMFDGTLWVSDFKQLHGYYPGPSYRAAKPPVTFYRHATILAAPPFAPATALVVA